jgi:radical SAM superfamily enzyme YgiQ (UPF0313 family)
MFGASRKRHRLRIVIPAYPAFNIYSRIARKTTALGPVSVASAANEVEGWDVEVIDENNLGRYGPKSGSEGADHEFLQQRRPADVVGLYGGLTSTIPRLYRIAQFYKRQGVITVAGGQHFVEDNIAEALSSGIDYIVVGEGEKTIKELLRTLEGGSSVGDVKGVAYMRDGRIIQNPKRDLITDFERLPLPDFSLVRYAKIKIYPVERIRGCGMDCEFCTVKGKPRYACPERLLEHISTLVETANARRFFIVDDLFGQQRDETIRFCELLRDYQETIGRTLSLTVQIRLDKARDTELLYAMRQAGIRTVAIGFESPIDEELLAMNKRIRSHEMLSYVRTFHKFGFFIHGMFIFGYPVEGNTAFTMPVKQRVKRFRDFVRQAKIDTVQVLLPVPLPGTALRRRLEKQERVYPLCDVGWEYYDGSFPLFEPDRLMSAEEMQQAAKRIMKHVYRFRYMFLVALKIFSFPSVILFLNNIKWGWRRWYRSWRSYLLRFGGWITIRKWTAAFKREGFDRKLQKARERLTTQWGSFSATSCDRTVLSTDCETPRSASRT